MIAIVLRTLRARWAGFVGTVVALALGVALVTTTLLCLFAVLDGRDGPSEWYAGADVVVVGRDELVLGSASAVELAEPPAVPSSLLDRLADFDGVDVAVADQRAPVELVGRELTARPWSVAGLAAGSLLSGSAPAAPDEIVVTEGAGVRPGERVRALTVDGPRELTVSGVMAGEAPVGYIQDDVAAGWSGGRIAAVAVTLTAGADPDDVLAAIRSAAPGLRVLTGADRVAAEPDPDRSRRLLGVTLLANAAAIASLAATFVVSGTFSYSVAQRRRELALLRASGAPPRQVRRLVRTEGLIIGVTAALVGSAIGLLGAPAVGRWLVDAGFAPAGMSLRFRWAPVGLAWALGIGSAVLGVVAAARRASAIQPIEALRDAVVDRRLMGRARWLGAVVLVGAAAGVVPLALGATTGIASAYLLLVTMALLLAIALLTPVLLPPLLASLAPFTRLGLGLVARSNLRAGLRRTASTAAPVIVTLGLTAATLATTATLSATAAAVERDRIVAPVVVSATSRVGVGPELEAALTALPGVSAVVPVATTSGYVEDDSGTRQVVVIRAPSEISRVWTLPLVAGSLDGLDLPETVVVSAQVAADRGWQVAGTARIWLRDGTPMAPEVVAVVAGLDDTVLLSMSSAGGTSYRPDTAYLALREGADIATVLPPVSAVAGGHGAVADSTGAFLAERTVQDEEVDRLAVLSVIGLTVTYTAISIATTFLMSTAERRCELATFRLTGATPRQLAGLIAIEAGLVVVVAAFLAGLVTVAVLALTAAALGGTGEVALTVPWGPVLLAGACCLLIALAAGLVPVLRSLRRPPLDAVGARE